MPKFSIIVGMYNHKQSLPKLLEALEAQTFRDFDVHFCDDGSSEFEDEIELEDFINDYGLENFEGFSFDWHVHRQEHKGMRLAKNLNQGIKNARGQYCVFIMGDSFPEEDYLFILNNYVTEERIICGIRIQIDEIKGRWEGVDMEWRIKKGLIPSIPAVVFGRPWQCMTGNGLTIPTSAMRKYGPWMEEIDGYGGEDNEIIARLFFKGYVPWSIPDLRLYHHWHKAQVTNKGNNKKVSMLIEKYYTTV